MAKVIHLETGIDPATDDDCLIVTRDLTGGFFVTSAEAGYQRGAAPSTNPVSESDRATTIERAISHADLSGIGTVYVVA